MTGFVAERVHVQRGPLGPDAAPASVETLPEDRLGAGRASTTAVATAAAVIAAARRITDQRCTRRPRSVASESACRRISHTTSIGDIGTSLMFCEVPKSGAQRPRWFWAKPVT